MSIISGGGGSIFERDSMRAWGECHLRAGRAGTQADERGANGAGRG